MADLKLKLKKNDNNVIRTNLKGRGALPVKRNINLAVVGVQKMNYKLMVPAIVLIIIAAALFSKFAVVDRMQAVSQKQGEAYSLQAQLDATVDAINGYSEMTNEYAHYTTSGMTQDELNQANRVQAMDLLDTIVLPQASVTGWTISANTLDINVIGSSLQQLNEIAAQLDEDERVDFCIVRTAATDNNTKVTTSSGKTEEVTTYVDVVGEITIYLTGAMEGGNQ